jgi:hypothetical protein
MQGACFDEDTLPHQIDLSPRDYRKNKPIPIYTRRPKRHWLLENWLVLNVLAPGAGVWAGTVIVFGRNVAPHAAPWEILVTALAPAAIGGLIVVITDLVQ